MWGSTWLVIKDQIGFLPIGWTVTARFTIAAIGMFLLARLRGEDLRLDRQRALLALPWGCCSSAAISSSSTARSIT
jgi:drug/metabolite transporter (DMT)-like permease